MLLGQSDIQAIVGRGRLQFEIEYSAETLAQGQSPGFIDSRAEWRMHDQLHAAAFIEETFSDDGVRRWHFSEHGSAFNNVFNHLLGAGIVEPAFLLKPGDGVSATAVISDVTKPENMFVVRSLISCRSSAT